MTELSVWSRSSKGGTRAGVNLLYQTKSKSIFWLTFSLKML